MKIDIGPFPIGIVELLAYRAEPASWDPAVLVNWADLKTGLEKKPAKAEEPDFKGYVIWRIVNHEEIWNRLGRPRKGWSKISKPIKQNISESWCHAWFDLNLSGTFHVFATRFDLPDYNHKQYAHILSVKSLRKYFGLFG